MRKVLGVAALGSAMLATVAYADNIPLPESAAAPLSARFAAQTVALLPPLQRIDLATQAPSGGDDPFNRLKGAIRHRFASAMIDLYPSDASGFHLSVGSRFFKKQYFLRDQQEATHDLLYSPRLPRGATGMRGFRRATPAASVGYSRVIDAKFALGVEAGALLGRVVEQLPNARRLAGMAGASRDNTAQMNPVVNLTVGYAF